MAFTPIRKNVPVKGMNTVSPRRNFTDEHSPNLTNAWYDDGVTLRRRLCTSILNQSLIPRALNIFEYKKVTSNLFVQDNTGTINLVDNVNNVFVPQTLPFTGKVRATVLKNFMIVGDGINPAHKWDGATWTPIPTPPLNEPAIGNIFHVHYGRVYAAGNANNPLTIYYSDALSSTGVDYWLPPVKPPVPTIGGFIDISSDVATGDAITGLTTHRGFLVVFCTNHVLFYNVQDPIGGTVSLFKSIIGEGCVSHDSIQPVGEDTIFLSPNGFKKLSVSLIQGDSQVSDVSSPINNLVKQQVASLTTMDYISSSYNARYGLYICSLGNGVSWALQPSYEGWAQWTGLDGILFTDSQQRVLHCNSYLQQLSNTVFQDEVAPNVFTPVPMTWEVAPFRGALEHKVRWNRIAIVYECDTNDIINVTTYPDLNFSEVFRSTHDISTAPISTTGSNDVGLKEGKSELPLSWRGEILSVVIMNTSNTDFRIKLVECFYVDGGYRE